MGECWTQCKGVDVCSPPKFESSSRQIWVPYFLIKSPSCSLVHFLFLNTTGDLGTVLFILRRNIGPLLLRSYPKKNYCCREITMDSYDGNEHSSCLQVSFGVGFGQWLGSSWGNHYWECSGIIRTCLVLLFQGNRFSVAHVYQKFKTGWSFLRI